MQCCQTFSSSGANSDEDGLPSRSPPTFSRRAPHRSHHLLTRSRSPPSDGVGENDGLAKSRRRGKRGCFTDGLVSVRINLHLHIRCDFIVILIFLKYDIHAIVYIESTHVITYILLLFVCVYGVFFCLLIGVVSIAVARTAAAC